MDVSHSESAAMAVLIDYESLPNDIPLVAIMRELSQRGRGLIKRAYGDWPRRSGVTNDLVRCGIDLIEMPSMSRGKSRIDMRLAIDAMEIVFSKSYINTFAIVHGNPDYVQLANKLRELNCRVIFVTKQCEQIPAANHCCDEWIRIGSQAKLTQPKKGVSRQSASDDRALPMHLLIAIACCLKYMDVDVSQKTELVRLAQTTRRLYPDICLNSLGFGKSGSWAKLIQIMEHDQWCEVEYDANVNNYFVKPAQRLLDLSSQAANAASASEQEKPLAQEDAASEDHKVESEMEYADCHNSVILPFAALKPNEE